MYKTERVLDVQNTLVAAKGNVVGGMDWEFGAGRCKLLLTY